ncbi:TIGR04438 family Trp-rich protein [Pseudoduganella violaceinigra]|uniref:TIGR04438 family Trp-rich protein n=1 Tax=Pseudoduganella violaceinigra TaxID=246602 RepID=UPI000402ED40|nr:TIGR04438 family Trp-rich protein [Pseudoduganella violaceinigra]
MPIILLLIALVALKYFEVWKFAEMSWWWIIGVAGVAFLWFEFVEPMLGLDKRKAHNIDEQRRKERIKKNFEDMQKRK